MFEDEDYNSDELIVSTKTEYDAEENALRPKTMADYVCLLYTSDAADE